MCLVNIYVDFIAASQGMGCDSAANHQIRMDFINVNLDTVLCFSRSSLRVESSKCFFAFLHVFQFHVEIFKNGCLIVDGGGYHFGHR